MADSTHITPKSAVTDTSTTSYHTPSRSRNTSRRTSRHETPLSSSPHRSINGSEKSTEVEDSRLSALDPRRFTPTLHANLVAEILNLRREVDSKNGLILGLEEQLVAAEDESKELEQTLSGNAQETRELRRRLDLLEGGSNTALHKLSQEKEAVHDSLAELKRRYEAVTKKLKTREDEVDRMNALWDSDKQHWDEQKRGLDRKAHVAETRIRSLLQELETVYAQVPDRRNSFQADRPTSRGSAVVPRPFSRASGARSALSHRRGGSIDSYEAPRFSLDDGLSRPTLAGNSLADELNMGSEDEDDTDGYTSGGALPEERRPVRPYSAQSNHESAKARKLLGLSAPDADENMLVPGEESRRRSESMTGVFLPQPRTSYQDVATQWSPPPSPTLQSHALDTIAEAESLLERDSVYSSKRDSMAGSIATLTDRAVSPTPTDTQPLKRVSMVSQACQTVEQPPSPPATPQSTTNSPWLVPKPEMNSISTQTEESPAPTSANLLQPLARDRPEVPFIHVRRPSTSHSRKESHEGPTLPPQTRSASCQTEVAAEYESVSVQTDDLLERMPESPDSQDQKSKRFSTKTMSTRASLVVPHRRSTNGERVSSLVRSFEYDTATKQLREINLRRERNSKRQSNYEDVFADFDGEHGGSELLDVLDLAELTDDSAASRDPVKKTLTKTKDGWKSIQRPKSVELRKRLSALDLMTPARAENEDDSDAENATSPSLPMDSPTLVLEDETGKTTQLSSAIGQFRSPPPDRPPPPIPADIPARAAPADSTPLLKQLEPRKAEMKEVASADPTGNVESDAAKGPKVAKKSREPDMRKMALISSGTTAHMQRPRSPSAPGPSTNSDLTLDPPFPVPDRHSSKKLSWQEEPPSPGPGTVTFYGGGIYGRKTIRKKSATRLRSGSVTRSSPRKGRKSPSFDASPPLSPSTFGLSSVTSEAPTSKRSDTNTQHESAHSSQERPQLPGHQVSRDHSGSAVESVQGSTTSDTSVVDAIAQTMVGEWMWKYVRRRKSFGLPGSAAAEFELGKSSDGNAQRHQRWVWLAPYERAVMWSAKQPTSGPALMGKSGRKLVIQSVLDVRDETPMPKGANQESSFGRSILILTAQRALKFTATSRERHYIWITALSFLSHSSVVPPSLGASLGAVPILSNDENDTLPPPIAAGPLGKRESQASLQRSKVHDSVRIAKDKKRPSLNPLSSTKRSVTAPSVNSVPSQPTAPAKPTPTEHVLEGLGQVSDEDDAAEPPLVPRFAKHTRKRSNTGLGVPPSRSFRSFASAQANASKPSVYSYGARSENGSHAGGWATDGGASTGRASVLSGMKRNISKRGSRAIGRSNGNGAMSEATSPIVGVGPADIEANANFFEAIGTVGMEAFVDGLDRMAADLNGSGPGRRTRKRDSLTVLRERSRSIDRKRASRISRDQQRRNRNVKKDSVSAPGSEKASELSASLAMALNKDSVPILSLPKRDDERERLREKARYEGNSQLSPEEKGPDMDFDFLKFSEFSLPKTENGDPFVNF